MTDYSIRPALVDERLAGGRLTIDLDVLVSNWQALDRRAPNSKTAAVVKANGYGLGTEPVVRVLANAGCTSFFVALPEEGILAKKAAPHANIYILGGLFKNAADTYGEAGLIPVLGTMSDIEQWSDFWKSRSMRKPCAIHVDTGMTRLGLSLNEAATMARDEQARNSVSPMLIMSHPACADDPDHEQNSMQLANFRKVMTLIPENTYSFANSAGVLAHERFHFDLNRPGIALYGGRAVNDVKNPMAPVVTLEARIIQVRNAKAGDGVGYGATERLKRDSKIAIVAVGYADGYLRSNSNTGIPLRKADGHSQGAFGWLGGYQVPTCGRVSMDLTTFDVTDVPDQVLGKAEWIELFGKNIDLDDVADASGTIGYELLTGLGARYSRAYLSNQVGT